MSHIWSCQSTKLTQKEEECMIQREVGNFFCEGTGLLFLVVAIGSLICATLGGNVTLTIELSSAVMLLGWGSLDFKVEERVCR